MREQVAVLFAVLVGCCGLAQNAWCLDSTEWQISTIFKNQSVVAKGGMVADAQHPHLLYIADSKNRVVWRMDLAEKRSQLLAGTPNSAADIVDGPPGTAQFSQPRGICQLSGSGDLLLVDGTKATAVVRLVNRHTGTVTTILGNASHAKGAPLDGTGSQAVLSSGSWLLVCRSDGTAVLADRQTGMYRHICPGQTANECGTIPATGPTPPGPPGPAPPGPPGPAPPGPPGPAPPGPDEPGKGGEKGMMLGWRLWAALGGLATGVVLLGAAWRGVNTLAGRKLQAYIGRMRAKHAGPRRLPPSGSVPELLGYEALPPSQGGTPPSAPIPQSLPHLSAASSLQPGPAACSNPIRALPAPGAAPVAATTTDSSQASVAATTGSPSAGGSHHRVADAADIVTHTYEPLSTGDSTSSLSSNSHSRMQPAATHHWAAPPVLHLPYLAGSSAVGSSNTTGGSVNSHAAVSWPVGSPCGQSMTGYSSNSGSAISNSTTAWDTPQSVTAGGRSGRSSGLSAAAAAAAVNDSSATAGRSTGNSSISSAGSTGSGTAAAAAAVGAALCSSILVAGTAMHPQDVACTTEPLTPHTIGNTSTVNRGAEASIMDPSASARYGSSANTAGSMSVASSSHGSRSVPGSQPPGGAGSFEQAGHNVSREWAAADAEARQPLMSAYRQSA